MTMRWFARLVACLLALLTGNATPASAASAATTTTASVTFAYDGATAARVDVGESEAAAATPTLLRGSRGGSASPLTSIPRTSTTPSTRSVATTRQEAHSTTQPCTGTCRKARQTLLEAWVVFRTRTSSDNRARCSTRPTTSTR
jgi:hypothetical protein